MNMPTWAVDLTAEVLGDDDGMVGAEASLLALEEFSVGGMHFGNLLTVDDEDAALAIVFILEAAEAFFAGEEGVTRPGGAAEQAGGIVGSSHGGEALVVDGGGDVLGFVHDEQGPGGGTDNVGMRLGGEEEGARPMDAEDVSGLTFPGTLKGKMAGEAIGETVDGEAGLREEGGAGGDDGCVAMGEDGHDVLVEGGEGFVLATLAGELPDEGLAVIVEDGLDDGFGGFDLIGAEDDMTEGGGEVADVVEDGADLVGWVLHGGAPSGGRELYTDCTDHTDQHG